MSETLFIPYPIPKLHLTRKEVLFMLKNLKLIQQSYDNISKTFFILHPIAKFVKTPQQIFLFVHFFKKDFESSKSCMISFEIRFPEICFQKIINFQVSFQIYTKTKKFRYLLKNHYFPVDNIQKNQLNC